MSQATRLGIRGGNGGERTDSEVRSRTHELRIEKAKLHVMPVVRDIELHAKTTLNMIPVIIGAAFLIVIVYNILARVLFYDPATGITSNGIYGLRELTYFALAIVALWGYFTVIRSEMILLPLQYAEPAVLWLAGILNKTASLIIPDAIESEIYKVDQVAGWIEEAKTSGAVTKLAESARTFIASLFAWTLVCSLFGMELMLYKSLAMIGFYFVLVTGWIITLRAWSSEPFWIYKIQDFGVYLTSVLLVWGILFSNFFPHALDGWVYDTGVIFRVGIALALAAFFPMKHEVEVKKLDGTTEIKVIGAGGGGKKLSLPSLKSIPWGLVAAVVVIGLVVYWIFGAPVGNQAMTRGRNWIDGMEQEYTGQSPATTPQPRVIAKRQHK